MSRAFPAVYEDTDLFALHIPERNAIEVLLSSRRKKLLADDKTVAGLNDGIDAGESAGQTVWHIHLQLIAGQMGAVENPHGEHQG